MTKRNKTRPDTADQQISSRPDTGIAPIKRKHLNKREEETTVLKRIQHSALESSTRETTLDNNATLCRDAMPRRSTRETTRQRNDARQTTRRSTNDATLDNKAAAAVRQQYAKRISTPRH